MSCGLLFAWPSATIPILLSEEYPLDTTVEECSYFSILPAVTMVLSSPIYSVLMNRLGRKFTLLLIAIPQLLSWIAVASANSIHIFYLARILNGISDGGIFTALPAYIGEISTPKVRGFWGNVTTLSIYFGEFFINLIGTFLNVQETAYAMSVFPILFVAAFSFMPESPYYLLMKGDVNAAAATLRKLRMKDNVDLELKQLEADVLRQTSEPGRFKDLFTIASNRKAVCVAGFARFAQQFSGISSFVVYNQYFFQQAGGDISYQTASNIFVGILFVFNTLACFLLDKMGRRMTMIVSCAGSCLVLMTEVLYFYVNDYTNIDLQPVNWYPVVGMVFYTVIYSLGLGIVPTLMLSEIFSTSVKGVGLTTMNVFFAVFSSGSTKIFQVLTSSLGLVGPMALFSISCLVSTIVSVLYIPETKGRTLEEIQQELKGNKSKKRSGSA